MRRAEFIHRFLLGRMELVRNSSGIVGIGAAVLEGAEDIANAAAAVAPFDPENGTENFAIPWMSLEAAERTERQALELANALTRGKLQTLLDVIDVAEGPDGLEAGNLKRWDAIKMARELLR